MNVPVLLLSDDLTGAAEAAAAFVLRTPRIIDLETLRSARASHAAGVVAVDTDSRYVSPELAAERCRTALALLPPVGVVVKKIDSALRGPVAAELAALREPGGLLVVAPALPALGRTVVGGAVLVDGVPLDRSAAWAAEPRPAPASVAEALAPLPVSVVSLAVVRGGVDGLVVALRSAADGDRVAVCDAETDDDLDRIVAAGVQVGGSLGGGAGVGDGGGVGVGMGAGVGLPGPSVRWAGSAGLAHALARANVGDLPSAAGTEPPTDASVAGVDARPAGHGAGSAPAGDAAGPAGADVRPVGHSGGPDSVPAGEAADAGAPVPVVEARLRTVPPPRGVLPVPPPVGPLLFVVGTAASAARVQLEWLARYLATVVELDPDQLADPDAAARDISTRTAGRTAAVHLTDARGAARSPDVVAALARVVGPAAREHRALVLTGGETARAVLAAIGVGELHVREAWDDGVVVSTAPGGRVVVTKPGAFGHPRTLVQIAQRLPSTRWHLHVEHSPQQEDT